MSRFYVKPEDIKNNEIHVAGDEAHHILCVCRLKKGDAVLAFDGLGNEYTGVIDKTEKKSIVISIQSRNKQSLLDTKILLAQSIPKMEKMDYIIQKTTELGVHSIIPMITERTIVRIDKNREARKLARWSRIAREAAKQCGRSDVPEIKEILDFKDILKTSRDYPLKIMPSLVEKKRTLLNLNTSSKKKNVIALVGPEGGFSPKELELARISKFEFISLGPYTLRSDTAAVVTVALLNHLLQ